jgi:hypothetical protein
MLEFAHFDRRRYPTVSARDGYGEWVPSYETTVEVGAISESPRELRDGLAKTVRTTRSSTHAFAILTA